MKRKSIKLIIKEFFFLNPTARLRVREIERRTGCPLPSVIRYTKELDGEGILKSVSVSNVRLYSADRGSENFIVQKRLHNMELLHESGLVGYLRTELSNPVIVLFGSYSRGDDVETSDIDIYIESTKKPNLKVFEKKLKRRIQLFIYRNIHEIENKELANNIVNGITLNGFIEVFRDEGR